MQRPIKKDQTYWKVLDAAVELDFRKGHQRWTLSELSRKSGITRSLIYYYFGRSKASILAEAVRLIGEDLCGLTPERVQKWKQGEFLDSLILARSVIDRAPHLGQFYLSLRLLPTDIGKELLSLEKEFQKKIGQFFSGGPLQAQAVFAVYFGAVFAPDLKRESLEQIIQLLQPLRLGAPVKS